MGGGGSESRLGSPTKILRNQFLDAGLDVKVRVSGKDSTVLTLEFILFNAVWARKLETDGVMNDAVQIGFKKVVVTDGDEWGREFTVRAD